MADIYGIRMAADLTDWQHKELQRQKDQGRIAYYRNGRLCFEEKRRSSRRGSPAGHDRRQHERMRQRQHHDHPEHSREHERTPDNTPLLTVDMNEYPALQRQQVPPTDLLQLQATETQGPLAASTPGLPKSAYATSGQILEEHWVSDNGSGVSANDNERQMVITADVDHNADAEITHDTSLEDTGSAEGGIHNDHSDHHAPHDQCPSGDHHASRDQSRSGEDHASRDQSPSGDHPLHISEEPPREPPRPSLRLMDRSEMQTCHLPLTRPQRNRLTDRFSLSLSLPPSLLLSLTPYLPLSLPASLPPSLSLSLPPSLSHSLPPSLSFSLTHTHVVSLSLSVSLYL